MRKKMSVWRRCLGIFEHLDSVSFLCIHSQDASPVVTSGVHMSNVELQQTPHL